MKIFRHIEDQELSTSGTVATMGNFDGIHLGHQTLVHNTVEESKRLGYPSTVLTFEPHPLKVLVPERAPSLILSYEDKMALLQSLGIDIVVAQRFDRQFASIAADEFVRRFLVERLKIKKLWVGRDLRFGQGRKRGERMICYSWQLTADSRWASWIPFYSMAFGSVARGSVSWLKKVASMKFDPCSGAITLYRVESLRDIAEAEN